MNLRAKFLDGSLIVYREKWGVVIYQSAIALICIWIAGYFYYFGNSKAPIAFLVVFCGMFLLGGLTVLIGLPRRVRRIFTNGGAQLLVADASGIALTPNIGGASRYNRWDAIAELILAETFLVSYADGDSDCFRCRLIVVFKPEAHKDGHWLNEFGTGVAKSGAGRAYLLGCYPGHDLKMVRQALENIVPNTLKIRRCTKVEFNRKSGEDSFSETTCQRA